MYYLVSKNGLKVPMNKDWYSDFEKIKWNENESISFHDDSGTTMIQTRPGKEQGQRTWVYTRLSGELKDSGIVMEL